MMQPIEIIETKVEPNDIRTNQHIYAFTKQQHKSAYIKQERLTFTFNILKNMICTEKAEKDMTQCSRRCFLNVNYSKKVVRLVSGQ